MSDIKIVLPINEKEYIRDCQLMYDKGRADERKRIVAELEKEYKLAEEEKRRCAYENQLQFEFAKGYSIGIWNALEIVRGE